MVTLAVRTHPYQIYKSKGVALTRNLIEFLAHWGIASLALWVASHVFRGIKFADKSSLFVSALLLGFANAIIKPVFIFLTFPLTIITFGFFLMVINALMVILVAAMVPGFKLSGFWTAFFAGIFIAAFSFFVGLFLFQSGNHPLIMTGQDGLMI